LLDERQYLLNQHRKHMDAILETAKKTPTNSEDADKILKDIDSLKSNVDKLVNESKQIYHRKLDEDEQSSKPK